MTASTDPKRQITVAASNQLRRMATKPRYVQELGRAATKVAGPFDAAGGAFPLDIPSEAFTHHLRELEAALDRAEVQFAALRGLAVSIRAIAEGRSEEGAPLPSDPIRDLGREIAAGDRAGAAVIAQIVADDHHNRNHDRHDPSIHEPPPPPEPKAMARKIIDSMLDDGMEPKEIEAAVKPSTMTWVCPEHGQYAEAISRKNRPYRYCPVADCGRLDIMLP